MLIAFTGKAGSGKSTAIEALKASGFGAVYNVKFAGPLYDIQKFIYSRISAVYTPPLDFLKDRKLLQWIGTEWGRDTISETLWVDLFKARYNNLKQKDDTVIITCDDCRFPNEAEMIHSLGGYVVEVSRANSAEHAVAGLGIEGHKSEISLNSNHIDYSVSNNGTPEEFTAKLKETFASMKARMAPGMAPTVAAEQEEEDDGIFPIT